MDRIKVAGIIKESVVDGPGIRLVVFAQGCKHNCPGCHNPETHPFNGGKDIKICEILEEIIGNHLLCGVTFSGGEPFEQAEGFTRLGEEIKKLGLNVLTYSGYTYEKILSHSIKNRAWKNLLQVTDILIDGPFDISKKDISLKFRGSSNQRLVDVQKSLKDGETVLCQI